MEGPDTENRSLAVTAMGKLVVMGAGGSNFPGP